MERQQTVRLFQEIAQQTIAFASSITFPFENEQLALVRNIDEYRQVCELRSRVYRQLGYTKEFVDYSYGLNFDTYDTRSAICLIRRDGQIIGTCRIVFDTVGFLPIESDFSLSYLRKKNDSLAELSRFIIDERYQGGSFAFRMLIKAMYGIIRDNSIDTAVSIIRNEHYRLYEKVGGFRTEATLRRFGNLSGPYRVVSWDIDDISYFFRRVFLRKADNLRQGHSQKV